MNELQKTQFNILKIFVDICERLNLTYFLVCGSALGTVKYSGFIPWDDDIDVALPREDYEVFIKEAPALLPEEYFIQNYMTDSNFPQIYTKLRNSKTTYIETTVKNLNINHGIYIDVFPLDGYPKTKGKAFFLELRKKVFTNIMAVPLTIERKGKSRFIYPISWILFKCIGNRKIADIYTRMISSYPISKSKYMCNHGNWQGKLEYAEKNQYGRGIMMCFEGMKVRIPEKYDEYLSQKYGRYMDDLPKDKKVGHHYYEICDCNCPYDMYIKKEKT